MKSIRRKPVFKEKDDLRLLGLSRIPRCAACPRLDALQACHDNRSALASELPPVPRGCVSPHCAPLASRYAPEEEARAGSDGVPTPCPTEHAFGRVRIA